MDKLSWKERWKKTFNRKSFSGFANKYGFPIVLLLCLCVIGVTAFLTSGGGKDPRNAGEKQGDGQELAAEDQRLDSLDITVKEPGLKEEQPSRTTGPEKGSAPKKEEQPAPTPTADGNEAPSDIPSGAPAEAGTEEAAVAVSTEATEGFPAMALPVEGDILQAYAMEELVFSRTLKEWTTHTGVDIAGPVGGEVRAALAGEVESIEEDPLKGIVITLAHDGGWKTVYMGLATKDMVRTGQKVEKGQVISGIGRTAAFEITEDPHLHFEVLQDGEYRDPMKGLPVK